jgi:hypothetical protein
MLCSTASLGAGLFDDLVRLGREIRRHLDAERFGGLEIDDELELSGLHNRQVGWLGAFQDFGHV